MVKNVCFVNQNKCYPTRLKKFFKFNLNSTNYNKIIPFIKQPILGDLPSELINVFPNKTRAENIKDFQKALANLSEYLRISYNKLKFQSQFNLYDKKHNRSMFMKMWTNNAEYFINDKIRNITNKFSINIEFVGCGSFASVYKLSFIDNKGQNLMRDKALKVYYNAKEANAFFASSHNNYAEANFWTYLKNAAGHSLVKTQFTQHYISDLKSAYCLTDFIGDDIPKTVNSLNIVDLFGIAYTDAKNNLPIFGKIYDGGGFEKRKNFVDDKVVLRYFKKLYYRNSEKDLKPVLENLEKQAKNPKNEHHNKIRKAIDLFKQYQLSKKK